MFAQWPTELSASVQAWVKRALIKQGYTKRTLHLCSCPPQPEWSPELKTYKKGHRKIPKYTRFMYFWPGTFYSLVFRKLFWAISPSSCHDSLKKMEMGLLHVTTWQIRALRSSPGNVGSGSSSRYHGRENCIHNVLYSWWSDEHALSAPEHVSITVINQRKPEGCCTWVTLLLHIPLFPSNLKQKHISISSILVSLFSPMLPTQLSLFILSSLQAQTQSSVPEHQYGLWVEIKNRFNHVH